MRKEPRPFKPQPIVANETRMENRPIDFNLYSIVENLKCCGNCKDARTCIWNDADFTGICDKWEYDKKTKEEREA